MGLNKNFKKINCFHLSLLLRKMVLINPYRTLTPLNCSENIKNLTADDVRQGYYDKIYLYHIKNNFITTMLYLY